MAARLLALIQDKLAEDTATGRLETQLPLDDLAYTMLRIAESFHYLPTITGEPADPDGATRVLRTLLHAPELSAQAGRLAAPSSPTASALLRRSRNAPACLKVSADEGERQDGCNHGVPLPDGAKARKAGSGVERITRQCCCGPAADIPHVVRPCRGNGAQAQDEVPDADCPHEQQIGTGRLPLA